ncbi:MULTISPECIES: hypothetical protein [Stappia]|uniref:Uncharacterized protein n=1 Tax=Stappia indica TaxID=538381 RepID=A0A857C816_9HYPH|nr:MULTISPECIES: hypothetical protein [Stappia]QGZ34642.1 hypothetical protein GH266_09025 [Stappia indica]
MFIEVANGLTEHSASVRSFEACAREARARIAGEPEHAVAWLLVSRAAQAFVDAYDDQPLTLDVAGQALEQFRDLLQTLETAYAGGSAEAKVEALNKIALRLNAM